MATQTRSVEIHIEDIEHGEIAAWLIGTTPLILNQRSQKVKRTLLFPAGPMTRVEKATNLKHDVLTEYQASPYRLHNGPTLIGFPSTGLKRAIASAALDTPGARKTEIGRLTYVVGEYVPVYGIPQMLISEVRQQDINRTPDIRTRTIFPTWSCPIHVRYVTPQLRAQAVGSLISRAGQTVGIGDWRTEKGAGDYGRFHLVMDDDPGVALLVATGGRGPQEAAMADPDFYNEETKEIYEWYQAEISRRGFGEVNSRRINFRERVATDDELAVVR